MILIESSREFQQKKIEFYSQLISNTLMQSIIIILRFDRIKSKFWENDKYKILYQKQKGLNICAPN